LVVVGVGALVAGAVYMTGGGSDEAARIGGAPLVLAAGDPCSPGHTCPKPGEASTFLPPPVPTPPVPQVPTLPASIDLAKMTLDPDQGRYVVPLADGRSAELTLDPTLQKLAERLLNQSRAPRGAIVVLAADGRVLALAGRRTDEPEGSTKGTFDWRLATEVWAPSASIFKLVTASALVKAGVAPDQRICFHGGIRSVSERNLRDDAKRDHRCEDLAYGVAHSNNAILGKLAFQKLEPSRLAAEAKLLGWTSTLPPTLSLAGTAGELVLPAARDLEFARTAAGFTNADSGARLSVMGGALVAATFARDGEQPPVRLVSAIDGVAIAPPPSKRVLEAETARAVGKMMEQTCTDGSATKVFGRSRTKVAGKTGTLTRTEPFYMEHSWFVGYAPAAKPEIVVSVLFGNPESWHLRGHEAARRLIDRFFKPAKAREKDRSAKRSRS
jgi:peptidoglycan glycosyltransferase